MPFYTRIRREHDDCSTRTRDAVEVEVAGCVKVLSGIWTAGDFSSASVPIWRCNVIVGLDQVYHSSELDCISTVRDEMLLILLVAVNSNCSRGNIVA